MGGLVFPGGQQVFAGGNKARQGSLGAAAILLEAVAAAGSSSRRPSHITQQVVLRYRQQNAFGLWGASELWYENLTRSPIQRCMSPEALFCTGFCHERWELEKKVNGGVVNHVDVVCPFFLLLQF